VSTASAQETEPTPATEDIIDSTAVVADTASVSKDLVDVAYVVDEAPDDMSVTLRGQLTKSLGEEGYVFQDESGVVHVRIDDDVLSADQFTEGMEVEIFGEVDKDNAEMTIVEVEMVTVI
ncbi:MAG TPA: NirD/YgiW/YdeI family stress tolerance protein, partial [Rhodothermales bacterium]